MIRRLLFAALCALVMALAACGDDDSNDDAAGGGDDTPATKQVADLGPVELTMWQHSFPPLNGWTKKQLRAFERVHPNVKVKYELVPFEEYNQKLLTALASGDAPELFESDDYLFAQLVENGTLAELSPTSLGFENLDALVAAYEPNSLDLVTDGDKLYGLPYDWEAPVIGYNLKLFRDAGVRPEELKSWSDTMQAAQKLSKHDGDKLSQSGFSFVHNLDVYYQIQGTTLFNQAGASVLNEDGTAAAINSPEAEQVFRLWSDAVHKYKVTSPAFSSSVYIEEFGKNRVGMGWMLVWANTALAPAGFKNGRNFDITLVPTFDGQPADSASYAWNWVVNDRASDDQAIAAQALYEFLSKQGASELVETGLINPRKGWRDRIPEQVASDYEQIFESLAASKPIEPSPKFNEVWKPVIDLFKEVEQNPNVDIPARLEEVEQQINDTLQS